MPSVYHYDESRNLSTHDLIREIESKANDKISADTITVYGAEKQFLDILRSCYGMGHRIPCHWEDHFTMQLKDTPGAVPNSMIWKQLQLKKNRHCQVTDVDHCTFRHYYNRLPADVLFCATTRTYFDKKNNLYYREPENTVNRRKSLRSNGIADYSAKQFRRYQRRYCPWAIESNDNMY